MISWEHWQTLLAVYRYSTFASAASKLSINATTVGRRIKLLEQRLGYSLFVRNDGKLVPTSSCASLVPYLESVSESLRTAQNESALTESASIWREVAITSAPFLISNLIAPGVGELAGRQRVRIELLGTGNNISISRREADIALKIEDGAFSIESQTELIIAEKLEALRFAVFHNKTHKADKLPWAGLIEEAYASNGMKMMSSLAASQGFQFRARHFDTLHMMVRSGNAKAMLPCFMGDTDPELERCSDEVLSLGLWMLSHRQDQQLPHLSEVRESMIKLCYKVLS